MNFFARFVGAVRRFMMGRYGTDTLNRHLVFFWLILSVINLVFHNLIIYLAELFVAFFVFFRMLSRNIVKRQRENATYYKFTQKFTRGFRHIFVRFRERKTTRFFHCPHCDAPMKMPKKIGRFRIRCQRCGEAFIKEFDR